MNHLRVTTLQTNIEWEAAASNRDRYTRMIDALEGPTDLIVLPEMFTTGFTMNPAAHAEPMDGPSVTWMAETAKRTGAAITGSLIIKAGGQYFNRLVFMRPDGGYDTYDKRHRFTMAGEHEAYAAGGERIILLYKGWRIRPTICYDLRFPAWMRNSGSVAYDLLLCVASWPGKRASDWSTLLQARAIENQAYVVGVNRVGTDPNGHAYSGNSCIIDPGPRRVLYEVTDVEAAHTETLSLDDLHAYRQRLPFLADRDRFIMEGGGSAAHRAPKG